MGEAWSIEALTVCRRGMHTRHCATEVGKSETAKSELLLSSHAITLILELMSPGLAIMQSELSTLDSAAKRVTKCQVL